MLIFESAIVNIQQHYLIITKPAHNIIRQGVFTSGPEMYSANKLDLSIFDHLFVHISINELVCKNPKYYCNQCAQKFFQGGVKKYVGAYNH